MKMPEKNEIRKPSKTMAGVTPIAVMLKPKKCKHGTCLYCPSLKVPQSYTPLSPPVIRAKMLKYNPYEQVKARLKAFKLMNHPTDKIELIVMGGTFLEYTKEYQNEFIKKCYDALNESNSKSLNEAIKKNETAEHRCVALCIESRPDRIDKTEIKRLLDFGCTRVELGVQAIDDKIYKKVNRGHKVKDVINSVKLLKDAGFKIGFHMMPGLPLSNPKKDIEMFTELFSNENFRPDQLKIYPCQVLKGSRLESEFKKGEFKPYTKEETESLLIKILQIIPGYCRVMRIMREIPPEYLIAGTIRIDLRKDVESYIIKNKIKLNEIRFREIGFNIRDSREKISDEVEIKKIEYDSNGGKEIFLQAVNKDNILFGLLRLRLCSSYLAELKGCSLVRELHVYGKTSKIGEHDEDSQQHKGLGKRLMAEAEKISKENGFNKIAVISGVGVREYYRKLGYKLVKSYMIKEL